eukprot:6095777-Pyramimonas_sp.AAC.2
MAGVKIPLTCVDCGRALSKPMCDERCVELYEYLRKSVVSSVATREMSLQQLKRSTGSLALLEVSRVFHIGTTLSCVATLKSSA